MLVMMCGLPFSGKSAVVDIIANKSTSSVCVVRPDDWLPKDLVDMNKNEVMYYRIECWKMAISKIEEFIDKRDSTDIVILDCCNSKFMTLNNIIKMARRNGHYLVVLYVNSKSIQCEDRAGSSWVGLDVIKSYVHNIRDSLPKFKNVCDHISIIENTGTFDDLEHNSLVAWSRLCQTI